MLNYTKEDIFRIVEEEDVEFIRLQFTDIFGNLKNVAITVSQLEKALDNKISFDPTAIDGYSDEGEEELLLHPDFSTFAIFPWRPQRGKVARMICDVYRQDGTPYEGDSRYILKQVVKEAKDLGYTFEVGPACEFFLFQADENGLPTTVTYEQAGYFDLGPIDFGENARRDMVISLENMGFQVEASHHESAPAQHEIDFKADEAIATADNILTFKLAVKSIARTHGLHATFMPKPKQGVDGSGMRINMKLYKDGKNIFYDAGGKDGLSEDAYHFVAGLMKHVRGMAAITNPIVNSYKRLVPGFDAPTEISYDRKNRRGMVNIPGTRDENVRISLRSPDPTANPYLTIALCLRAGLQGIREKAEWNDKKETMPDNLYEAIRAMENDEMIESVLGTDVFRRYSALKKAEWNRYREQITNWEINEYLYRF
ncbi:MAG: glutamine synthetase family protein [Lachnospiraceae bacterium]